MYEITKSDWKLFRERVSIWQEHYIERLIQEYVQLLNAPGQASDHFWELDERIRKDRKHPGVVIQLRKSDAVWDIAYLVNEGVINMDELNGFSDDLIEAVKRINSMNN